MQFEAVEPAQRAFATLCYPLEHLVYVYALVAAHPQQGAVNKTDAGTFAQEAFLNENDKLHHHGFLQLCKPVVRNDLGKQVPVPDAYFIQVKVFQTFVIGAVEHYHDEYDFGLGQTAVTVIFALPVFSWDFKSSAAEHRVKNLAELVCHYKNFHNFVIGEHSDRSICLKLSTLNLILLSLTTKFSTIYFHRTHVNIVLLCPACHKIIDSDPEKYTIEIVEGMKKRHEDRIRLVTGIAHDKKSHVVTYYSKIGKHLPNFSFNTISSVLFPEYYPEASTAIEISMKGNVMKESDPNFWEIEDNNLQTAFAYEVKQRIQYSETKHISLFSFADMPLLVRLGTLFNDIRELKVYQPHRDTKKWEWQESGDENIEFRIIEPAEKSKQPVLVFALSATAITERIRTLYSSQDVSIWTVTCTNPNNNFLKTEAKLNEFASFTREVLDKIKASSVYNEILVHMAMPVACAFMLGHVWMPKADMKLILHDYYNNTENRAIIIE